MSAKLTQFCIFFSPTLVYNLLVQLLLGFARAVTHGSKFRRTHDHTLLSHLRLPQLGGSGPRIYIPQEQGGPVIPLGTGFVVTNFKSNNLFPGFMARGSVVG
jgi:hypothetical protein